MKDLLSAVPPLLNDLYEHATAPDQQWLEFLEKFAGLFKADTAALRLTDLNDPVVYCSYTVGFHHSANQYYESGAVEQDPFRQTLANNPLGKVVQSPSIISDRDFERSEHYQHVFRPNGNFYAIGTQFERENGQAMHIGVHRPRSKGAFDGEELAALEIFSPHLRRATRLSHLMADLNQALDQAHHALDQLPFGVWLTDGRLRVQWMNNAAEEAVTTNSHGLKLRANQLQIGSSENLTALRTLSRRLHENQSLTETLKLDQSGTCLVMTQARRSETGFRIGRAMNPGILCFLLDPTRPAMLDRKQLTTLYALTPAEYRLANLLVSGLDVNEASGLLQISPHTGRTQMKSIMRKTGVNRQTALQRKLLLCADALRRLDA